MDTITIELRSRLRSCNIFISSEKGLRKKIENNTISLKLKDKEIILKIGNKIFHLPLVTAKIIPKTLSSLTVRDNWISLRVQTQPKRSAYGSFSREIVNAKDDDDEEEEKDSKLKKLSTPVELCLKEKDLVVNCTRCKNCITDVVFFKRVLPLPSGNTDPGEWFCCNHAGENYKTLTEPGESDCFYEKDYRLLNEALFKKELKIDDKNDNQTIRCNRCFSSIGYRRKESVKKEGSVKVWNCCVDYKFLNRSEIDLNSSDPLNDFLTILLDRTDIFTGNKIILQTSEGIRYHYLIVRVMDKNLELLVENDFHRNDEAETTDSIVKLSSIKVTKVLYKYSDSEEGIKNQSVDVDRYQIALPVMLAAVDHLSSTTKRYPPACRVIDEYFVGYINSCCNKNA